MRRPFGSPVNRPIYPTRGLNTVARRLYWLQIAAIIGQQLPSYGPEPDELYRATRDLKLPFATPTDD
jgi:hypothetical protein